MKNIKINPRNKKSQVIKRLHHRIFELEQTLNSIQSGEVDAFIIKNEKGLDSVFTLEGADQPYRMLLESFSQGAVSLTKDAVITHCNQSFSDMIQIPVETLIGTSFLNYIVPSQHAELLHFLVLGKEENHKKEFLLNTINNPVKTLLFISNFLELGHANGLSIIVIDITEFKNKQQKIEVANIHYRAIMDNASCGFLIHEKHGTILDVNKQAELILGSSKANLIGQKFDKFIPVSHKSYYHLQIEKLLIEKKIGPNQGIVKQSGGDIITVEFSAVCLEVGNQTLLFSIMNDTTERNRLQKQALLNDKLVTIGTLAAGIIHEINNPLTSVLANLGYLNKKLKKLEVINGPNAEVITTLKQVIDESIDSAKRIHEIINELKVYSRSDDSETPTSADIHDILDSVIKMAHPQFKNITLEKNYGIDIPTLFTNHRKLHQVFLNILINATQSFSSEESHNVVKITTSVDNDRIRIDVSDNGKGMTDDIKSRIFDPFFTTKPAGVGTGLGLSICKDIINNEAGEITVSSVVGQGTVFSLFLPFKRHIVSPDLLQQNNQKSKPRQRILVVDDESTLIHTIRRFLEKHHEVTTALGGQDAFRILQIQPMEFDVIITDLNMPDINGADLYRYISGHYPGREKSIIFITGESFSAATNIFLTSIKNICIEKPFTAEKLLQAIDICE